MPHRCHGSAEKMAAWAKEKDEEFVALGVAADRRARDCDAIRDDIRWKPPCEHK
jgi:hypothetical protein